MNEYIKEAMMDMYLRMVRIRELKAKRRLCSLRARYPALCICILERRLSQQACANVCGTTIILPARIADTVI